MAMNIGTVPVDFSEPVGRFRLLANDLVSIPLSPDVDGSGQYEMFSDDEITAYIGLYPASLFRAVGTAYMGLAARAATESSIVKDYDLQADLTKKATDLRLVAQGFFDRADADAEILGDLSGFGLSGGSLIHSGGVFHHWESEWSELSPYDDFGNVISDGSDANYGNGGYGQ